MPSAAPNLLLIVSDQQHPDMIGALGRVAVQTPSLDRFCADGTAFTRAYTACPLCTPSRATLLSGQYPSRHGAWSIGTDTPDDIVSLPRLLGERAGYHTAIIGKSHFKPCLRPGSIESLPRARDWEYWRGWSGPWFGFQHARICVAHTHEAHAYCMHYGLWLRERGIPPALPYFSPHMEEGNVLTDDGAWALPTEYHVSRWVADETIAYLHDRAAREPDRPWYACVNFPDPHPPFVAPAPWHGRHADTSLPPPVRRPDEWEGAPSLYQATLDGTLMERGWHDHARPPAQFGLRTPTIARTPEEERRWRTHMDMTALTDHHIGRILDTLDALDQTRDTLVVFTSDHGDYLGDHYLWAKGGSHYDGAVRVPFVVRWPGTVPAGMRSDALQSLVDIAPTFLAAAGIEPHPEMQGIDALPTWGQPDRPMRDAVLIEQRVERGLYVNTRITARTRLSVHSLFGEARDELEYYDFATDPGELWNRAGDAAYAALVQAELAALLRSRLTVSGPWQERTSFA